MLLSGGPPDFSQIPHYHHTYSWRHPVSCDDTNAALATSAAQQLQPLPRRSHVPAVGPHGSDLLFAVVFVIFLCLVKRPRVSGEPCGDSTYYVPRHYCTSRSGLWLDFRTMVAWPGTLVRSSAPHACLRPATPGFRFTDWSNIGPLCMHDNNMQ